MNIEHIQIYNIICVSQFFFSLCFQKYACGKETQETMQNDQRDYHHLYIEYNTKKK